MSKFKLLDDGLVINKVSKTYGNKKVVRELNNRDFEIVNAIKPKLIKKGILVAGIDILGSFLTEINITSPTCFRELYDQQGINLANDLIEQIEKAF